MCWTQPEQPQGAAASHFHLSYTVGGDVMKEVMELGFWEMAE